MTEKPKLTLPIVEGRKYVRRNGQVSTAQQRNGPVMFFDCGADVFASTGRMQANPFVHPHDLVADHVEPVAEQPKPDGHPYAELLRWIADGKSIDRRTYCRGWHEVCHHDALQDLLEFPYPPEHYRVRPEPPKTIRIGDAEVPEPLRVAPEPLTEVYMANLIAASVSAIRWERLYDSYLPRGLIYATKEGAQAVVDAVAALLSQKA